MKSASLFTAGWQFGLGGAFAWAIAVSALSVVGHVTKPYDDCDGAQERCGLRVHTDAKTGLQYLSTPGGGIVPRMGADGQQIREAK